MFSLKCLNPDYLITFITTFQLPSHRDDVQRLTENFKLICCTFFEVAIEPSSGFSFLNDAIDVTCAVLLLRIFLRNKIIKLCMSSLYSKAFNEITVVNFIFNGMFLQATSSGKVSLKKNSRRSMSLTWQENSQPLHVFWKNT